MDIHKQRMIAHLSRRALEQSDLSAFITEAFGVVADGLGVDRVGLFDAIPNRAELTLRTGIGWQPESVGSLVVPIPGDPKVFLEQTAGGTPILRGFHLAHVGEQQASHQTDLKDSAIFIGVRGRRRQYGLLAAFGEHDRIFSEHDGLFLGTVSNIIGAAYDHAWVEERLQLRDDTIVATRTGLVITNPHEDDNPVVYVNTAFEQITGYAGDEIRGRNCRFLQGPATDPAAVAKLRNAIEAEQKCEVEILNYRKDGVPFWSLLSISPIFDHSGRISHFVAIIRDVTEHKRTKEVIQRLNHKTELILTSAGEGIIGFDVDGSVTFINPAATQMLGFTLDELSELKGHPFLHPNNQDCATTHPVPCIIYTTIHEGTEQKKMDEAFYREDGTQFPVQLVSAPIIENDVVVGAVVIFSDITERKRVEQERAAAEALRQTEVLKAQFFAAISHDFRTPLHHIKGYASNLLQNGANVPAETQIEFLNIITDEADTLISLLVDLLSTSQIDTDALKLTLTTVQVDQLVRTTVQRWHGIESHRFTVVAPPSVPPVAADGVRLLQVLNNLIGNVVRHTPSDTEATIEVIVQRQEVIVAVRDKGPGIGDEHIPHVFERFYQATPHGVSRGGHGLGLFICKSIIERHGGRTWIETGQGFSTSVCFALPRRVHTPQLINSQKTRRLKEEP